MTAASTTRKCVVKWNTKIFSLEIDPEEPLELFQAQLLTLTSVPVTRQKLMAKAKLIKSDDEFRALCALGGAAPVRLTLMGTSEGGDLVQPQEKVIFIEDLTPTEKAKLFKEKQVIALPNGIVNMGNTCYLASVLQMLRPASELTKAIVSDKHSPNMGDVPSAIFAASGMQGSGRRLELAVRDFYKQWDSTVEPVSPVLLVPALREAFPQFSRRSTSSAGITGVPMQQDAEECMSCLLNSLNDSLPLASDSEICKSLPYASAGPNSRVVDALFSMQMQVQTKTITDEGVKVSTQMERHRKFTCFLGTISKPVSTLDEGLAFSLGDEEIDGTAAPATAGDAKPAPVVRSTKLDAFSLYFVVHFMRFEWKAGGAQAEKAKICKSVKFAPSLDLYIHCTAELQETLKVGRAVMALRREREVESKGNTVTAVVPAETTPTDVSAESMQTDEAPVRSYPTGVFQLLSVVTHQGRHADSGHYVCWAKLKDQEEQNKPTEHKEGNKENDETQKKVRRQKQVTSWAKFDDEKVTEIPWENIDLAGGRSDFHVAYLLLFKQTVITPTAEELETVNKAEEESQAAKKFKSSNEETAATPEERK